MSRHCLGEVMQALLHLILAAVVMAVTIGVVAFIILWHEISNNIVSEVGKWKALIAFSIGLLMAAMIMTG
jgi:hypothetical protein